MHWYQKLSSGKVAQAQFIVKLLLSLGEKCRGQEC